MTYFEFCEALSLDHDRFALTVYQMSDEYQEEWLRWAQKRKRPTLYKFWKEMLFARLDENLKRARERARRAKKGRVE